VSPGGDLQAGGTTDVTLLSIDSKSIPQRNATGMDRCGLVIAYPANTMAK